MLPTSVYLPTPTMMSMYEAIFFLDSEKEHRKKGSVLIPHLAPPYPILPHLTSSYPTHQESVPDFGKLEMHPLWGFMLQPSERSIGLGWL